MFIITYLPLRASHKSLYMDHFQLVCKVTILFLSFLKK